MVDPRMVRGEMTPDDFDSGERDECKHGSLWRSCEICERDDEIDRLRAELAEKDKRIAELERRAINAEAVVRRWESEAGGCIFTDDQINAAWEYATHPSVDPDAIRALNRMGIVACERCGGTNSFMGDPCTCPTNGWVMEGR